MPERKNDGLLSFNVTKLLILHLGEWVNDPSLFIKGEVGRFSEFINKNCLLSKLIEPDSKIDQSSIIYLYI